MLVRPTEGDVAAMALFLCEDLGGYLWHTELVTLQNRYKQDARRILNEHYNKQFDEVVDSVK